MKVRIISGVIGALLLVAVLVASIWLPICFNLALSVISAIAAWEIAGATGCRCSKTVTYAGMIFAAAAPLVPLVSGQIATAQYPLTFTLLCAYAFFLLLHQIFYHKEISLPDLVTNLATVALTSVALSCLIYIRDIGNDVSASTFLLLFTLITAWSSDSGAYFFGVFFGKHKLAPEISPKKTVEGFLGGILSCILCAELAALAYLLLAQPTQQVSFFSVALIAALGSVFSVAGDLTFSLVKRHYQIKDFGTIMPGHGGVLDRFDSVIFVAPFVYLLIQYLPIIHA